MEFVLVRCIRRPCSCVVCMEGCHPMFNDACGCTCEAVVLPSDLQLRSVRLSEDGRLSTKKVSSRDVSIEYSKIC